MDDGLSETSTEKKFQLLLHMKPLMKKISRLHMKHIQLKEIPELPDKLGTLL